MAGDDSRDDSHVEFVTEGMQKRPSGDDDQLVLFDHAAALARAIDALLSAGLGEQARPLARELTLLLSPVDDGGIKDV
jgi:hypothetical protein